MYRSTTILVMLALALGLWIGFNPQAHASAEKAWQHEKVALAKLDVQIKAAIDRNSGHASEKSAPPATSSKTPATSDLVKQVQDTLQRLVASLERVWNDLISRTRRTA